MNKQFYTDKRNVTHLLLIRRQDNMTLLLRLSVIRYSKNRLRSIHRRRSKRKNFHELYVLFHPQKAS